MQKWMNFTHNRVVIQTFRRGGCVFSRKRRLHEAFTHDVLRGVYNFSNSPENVFLTWAKRNTWLWVSYIRFNALCPWRLDCRGFQGIYHAALTHQNHLGEFNLTVFSEECSVLVRLIKTIGYVYMKKIQNYIMISFREACPALKHKIDIEGGTAAKLALPKARYTSWGPGSSESIVTSKTYPKLSVWNPIAFAGGHFSCTLHERPEMKLKQ